MIGLLIFGLILNSVIMFLLFNAFEEINDLPDSLQLILIIGMLIPYVLTICVLFWIICKPILKMFTKFISSETIIKITRKLIQW